MRFFSIRAAHAFVALVFLALGCDRAEVKGEAPPVKAPVRANPCAKVPSDTIHSLPRKVGGYCVDPASDVRAYGVVAPSPLDDVCVELFNGECELYKSYGLEKVVTSRYVPDDGSSKQVTVVLSSFRHSEGAYGFYSRRVLGDDRPSQLTVKPLDLEGRGVLGVGMAVVFRGKHVIEATYVSEEETPEEIEENAPLALIPLSREMAHSLRGTTVPALGIQFLESLGAGTTGTLVLSDGILSERGTGPGQVAYFEKTPTPHRVLLAERRDEDGAKDLLRLLRRALPGEKVKGKELFEVRHTREGEPPESWYLARSGAALFLVGPLESQRSQGPTTAEERERSAAQFKTFAFERLSEVQALYGEFIKKAEAEEFVRQ